MHKAPNVFPIVGQRKVEHLKGNIEALKVSLSKQDIHEIDDAAQFDPGFPMNFIFRGAGPYHTDFNAGDVSLTKSAAHIDALPKQPPVPHGEH